MESQSLSAVTHTLTVNGGTITFTGSVHLNGASLEAVASAITVNENVTLDTRKRDATGTVGDSGSITFDAPTITIGSGAKLLAGVDGSSFSAGDVTLDAENDASRASTLIPIFNGSENTAEIKITSAEITGGSISIKATADDVNFYDDYGDYADAALSSLVNLAGQIPGLALSQILGIAGQISLRHATATVSLVDSAITASETVSVASKATTDASMHIVSLNGARGASKFAIAIGYGEAFATATTTLDGHDNRRRRRRRRHV